MALPVGNFPSNPFDNAFEMLGRVPEVVTEAVNADALELLTRALTTRANERGRMILLRSPRAGFGKTHLLMRLHQRVAHTHEFIPLEPSKGRYLDAQAVLDAVLRRFSRILPAGGGLTVLDLLARRILAAGLEPLVRSGEVPSQDRDSALQALQLRPVETFDFHNEDAVTAQWAVTNFSLLGPRLTAELAERTNAGYRPVAWWVELLFKYSSAPIDQASRNSSLFETVFGGGGVETDMHEKLVALLNLTGLVTSPVLILDEVEGFSSNPDAALQVATFLNALHQSCSKLALIISVNGDVWETAFLPRLPCGLKDRLSDIVVDLKPLGREEATIMLRDRAGEHADAVLDAVDFDTGVVYARGLIREAAKVWESIPVVSEEESGADQGSVAMQEPVSLIGELGASEVSHGRGGGENEGSSADIVDAQVGTVETLQEDKEDAEGEVDLHAPPVVVVPEVKGVDPGGGAFAEVGSGVGNVGGEESAEPEQGGHGHRGLPDGLPQPFAQMGQSAPSVEPRLPVEPEQPEVRTSVVEPQSPFGVAGAPQQDQVIPSNVVDSPFAIDAGPVESPFQVPQPSLDSVVGQGGGQPVSPEIPPAGGVVEPVRASEAPFQAGDGKTPPHSVTSRDAERVEDLLRQFRDRYGRE